MSYKKTVLLLVILSMLVISACSGTSTQEKIYGHLEEAVHLESDFEKQQSKIKELEKEEQEIYSKIIDLTAEELDEIKKLSQQALETIEQRTETMEIENESINASQDEFKKVKELIDKLEEPEEKKKAEAMYTVMNDRYNNYDNLFEAYIDSLSLEKDLYELLPKEEVEQEAITSQITEINDMYKKVLKFNEEFNDNTAKYNELKKEFYEVAQIEVKYVED